MSLRERNRRSAMRAIQEVALRRFQVDGFESVTVEDIAAAAEVSPSTVYRYFKTKEALVVWDERDATLGAALERSMGALPPFEALATAFVEAYTLDASESAAQRARADLIDATPALIAAQAAALDGARDELVAALARAYGRSARDLELELQVRVALAALLTGFQRWQGSKSRRSLANWIAEAFRAAPRALQSGNLGRPGG